MSQTREMKILMGTCTGPSRTLCSAGRWRGDGLSMVIHTVALCQLTPWDQGAAVCARLVLRAKMKGIGSPGKLPTEP